MKKDLKKLIATSVLVFALVVAGAVPAFAADTEAIQVQYNGENIEFTVTEPTLVNGRTMVPFRHTLEAIGASVDYDAETRTVFAETEDVAFSFVVGSTEMTVVKDGETVVKTIDGTSFIDPASKYTYVPIRFAAEAMGHYVGWDADSKTVVIIDPKTLFGEADKDFSIIAKLMTTDVDFEKSYESMGSFSMDMTMSDLPMIGDAEFSVSGDMSGITRGMDADMTMNMSIDMDQMLEAMTDEEKAVMEPTLDMMKDMEMKMKMEGESGLIYMSSNLFALIDPSQSDNTWYEMNLYDMYDSIGVDLRSMMSMTSVEMTLADLLELSFFSAGPVDDSTYATIKTGYALLKELVGDEAFSVRTVGATKTYTLNLSEASAAAAAARVALAEGLSASDLAALAGSSFSANISISERNGVLSSYDMKGSGTFEDVSFSFDMSGNSMDVVLKMMVDQKDAYKINMEYDVKSAETRKTPDLSLPEGATVEEYPLPYTL